MYSRGNRGEETVAGTHLWPFQQLLDPRCTGRLRQAMQQKQKRRVRRVVEIDEDPDWVLWVPKG